MKNTIAITLLMFTTACAITRKEMKETKEPKETTVTMTPPELAEAFQYRDNKIFAELEMLRKDFADMEERNEKLRDKIFKKVKDCLCPGDMK